MGWRFAGNDATTSASSSSLLLGGSVRRSIVFVQQIIPLAIEKFLNFLAHHRPDFIPEPVECFHCRHQFTLEIVIMVNIEIFAHGIKVHAQESFLLSIEKSNWRLLGTPSPDISAKKTKMGLIQVARQLKFFWQLEPSQ